jgi:hypothetical protein
MASRMMENEEQVALKVEQFRGSHSSGSGGEGSTFQVILEEVMVRDCHRLIRASIVIL